MLTLPNEDLYLQLIYGLVDNGWNGSWNIKDDKIVIDNGQTMIKRLKNKPLDYYEALRLAMCIGINLASLVPLNKSILFLSLDDIYVIDQDWYILSSLEKLVPIISKNTVMLTRSISFKGYLAPELKNIKSLPFKTNITSIYYSLAALIIEALAIDNLSPLAGSKLYFFLQRCFFINPEERYFLFI
tara:strand:+ start:1670 stop:2227 length:558 start_codon:yes stop_codon:yes gene_type:complete